MKRKKEGITLIALVITIVILVILGGVAFNLAIGENGLFTQAKEAKKQYEIAQMREEIEIAMLQIQAEKSSENGNFTIDDILIELPKKIADVVVEKEGNKLKGSYKGYNFTINEDINLLVEGESLQADISTDVIAYLGKNENEKYAVKIMLTLNADETISKIEIENTDGTTTTETVNNNTYSKELEIELDKEYKINIESENSLKTIKKISVSSVTNISNVEQLVEFRDSVNSGLTYEGATINLLNDIDLSGVCYRVDGTTTNDVSWEPIGNRTYEFRGTFNGNYNKIKKLYINSEQNDVAFFKYLKRGTIKQLIIDEDSKIIGNHNVGGIVARTSSNALIIECGNHAEIIGNKYVGGILGGNLNSDIKQSYNKGKITAKEDNAGGIVGYSSIDNSRIRTIENCYNIGDIEGKKAVGGIVGGAGDKTHIYNCYNAGSILKKYDENKSNEFVGGIAGKLRAYGKIENCYNKGNITNEGLGGKVGGIVGENSAFDGTITNVEERKSIVVSCYNYANLISNVGYTGGISGLNSKYCNVENCYIYSNIKIKYNDTLATENIGNSTSGQLGKIIGINEGEETNNGVLDEMPSVYYVVNGLCNEKSRYWSNSNLEQPKLLWEK